MVKRISSLAHGYVEQHTNIFSPPPAPLFVSLIPLTHHSSSHVCLLPPASPYLPSSVLILLYFQRLPVFFFLSMSVLIHPQHSSPPQSSAASCMLDCCNDTNNLFGHSWISLACVYFCVSFPSLASCHWTRECPVKVNSWTYTQRVIHP